MRVVALILLLALGTSTAFGQSTGTGTLARDAAEALAAASVQLENAETARDRVRALTRTIQAYEAGLSAMRSGLRAAAIQEEQLRRSLSARDAEIAELLAVLQRLTPDATPTAFLHPQGPNGTARAGLLLAELTPALNQRAATLRTDLENVTTLRTLQEDAIGSMQKALAEVQLARSALNQAMAERQDLPKRFVEDPVRTALLLASSETLSAFATGLADVVTSETAWQPAPIEDRIGSLDMPVRGVLLRAVGEADAAGIVRPGVLIATRPGALVTAPSEATLRYVGPLLDYGTVTILEPRPGTFFVFAGLGATYGAAGDIVAEGTPLGLMGGLENQSDEFSSSTGGEGAGVNRSETLYIEVRQDNVTEDPARWFRINKDR